MKYTTGEDVRLWDRVEMWGSSPGIIVFCIDSDEFSSIYPKEYWAYLGRGSMVDCVGGGLVHYTDDDTDLRLVARGEAPLPGEWAALRKLQFSVKDSEWRSGPDVSLQIGCVNSNGQICTGHRFAPGTDPVQRSYRVECGFCGATYGTNGSDMHNRLCPSCQGGAAGIPV